MSVLFGCVSQFTHRTEPGYYIGYALIGVGALLLLVTLMAVRHRPILTLLRYLLGALLALLLIGVLIGFDRIPGMRPRGQFVSLVEIPQDPGAAGLTA
jgi:hypothetical protein